MLFDLLSVELIARQQTLALVAAPSKFFLIAAKTSLRASESKTSAGNVTDPAPSSSIATFNVLRRSPVKNNLASWAIFNKALFVKPWPSVVRTVWSFSLIEILSLLDEWINMVRQTAGLLPDPIIPALSGTRLQLRNERRCTIPNAVLAGRTAIILIAHQITMAPRMRAVGASLPDRHLDGWAGLCPEGARALSPGF